METLADFRKYRRLGQREVARRIGVTQQAVSKMEFSESIAFRRVVQFLEALGGDVKMEVQFQGGEEWRLL